MGTPGGTVVWGVVDYDMRANGGDRVSIEIILSAMETLVGRKGGVGSPGVKEVIRDVDLGKGVVPALEGKARIGSMETGDEVIFPCANDAFSLVGALVIGRDELDSDISLELEEKAQAGTCFIIHAVECWLVIELAIIGKCGTIGFDKRG
jgi:hypothetical protein